MKRSLLKYLLFILSNQAGNFTPGDGGTPDPGAGGGAPDPGEGDQVVYPEGFDESLMGNETLLKHYDKEKKSFNMGNMMKSLVHASSALGKDKMNVPDKTWDADKWRETMRSLGVPDTVEKYQLANNIPEGLQANDTFFNTFRDKSHEIGILPHQAQHMLDWYNTMIGDQTKESNMMAKQSFDADRKVIKDEYGNAFDRKMEVAQSGIEAFADVEAIKRMTDKGLLDDPDFTKFMVSIGEAMGEDTFNDDTVKKGSMTLPEIEGEISKMYAKDHPYQISGHPKRPFYEKEFLRLQTLKLKARGVQNKQIM